MACAHALQNKRSASAVLARYTGAAQRTACAVERDVITIHCRRHDSLTKEGYKRLEYSCHSLSRISSACAPLPAVHVVAACAPSVSAVPLHLAAKARHQIDVLRRDALDHVERHRRTVDSPRARSDERWRTRSSTRLRASTLEALLHALPRRRC